MELRDDIDEVLCGQLVDSAGADQTDEFVELDPVLHRSRRGDVDPGGLPVPRSLLERRLRLWRVPAEVRYSQCGELAGDQVLADCCLSQRLEAPAVAGATAAAAELVLDAVTDAGRGRSLTNPDAGISLSLLPAKECQRVQLVTACAITGALPSLDSADRYFAAPRLARRHPDTAPFDASDEFFAFRDRLRSVSLAANLRRGVEAAGVLVHVHKNLSGTA
jgi:hypothetical protein